MQHEINLFEHSHEECHERVTEALDRIQTGDTAIVIADHDTKPVFYMYQAQRGYSLDSEYLETGPDVWKVRVTKGPKRADELQPETFDVRAMPPRQRHSSILAMFDALLPGDGFVLVNDHDPKPMYYQLRSIRGDGFEWKYLKQGPSEWRIQITKTEESVLEETTASVTIDVRKIPHAERHQTIFHSVNTLPDNESMELVADHAPEPLRYALRQRYGDALSWNYLEQGPDVWRVLLTKGSPLATDGPAQNAVEMPELDVRRYMPAQRHSAIFETYDALKPGDAFILVNDHDPKPLYYQFEAEMKGRFRWEYLQSGPDEWKVLIGKTK